MSSDSECIEVRSINELERRDFKNHQSKWEQKIFSNFLKNESEWMKRAKVDSGTIRSHFGDGPRRKFGREWVYPIEFYVEHALNLRKCSKLTTRFSYITL